MTTHPTLRPRLLAALVLLACALPGPAGVGAMPSITIRGMVWSDTNCDGVRQDAEPPFTRTQVAFFAAGDDGVVGTPDDQVIGISSVGDTGQFGFFNGITDLDYRLVILVRHRPIGYTPAPYRQGDDPTRDNDLTIVGSPGVWATEAFRLDENKTVTGIDIGLCAIVYAHSVHLPLMQQ